MIIETNSEKETWDLGFSLGRKSLRRTGVYIGGRSGCREDDIYQRSCQRTGDR